MNWIEPYMDEIKLVLIFLAALTIFWSVWLSVQWIRVSKGKSPLRLLRRKYDPFKLPTEIVISNVDKVTLEKRPDGREYVIRLKLKDENNDGRTN